MRYILLLITMVIGLQSSIFAHADLLKQKVTNAWYTPGDNDPRVVGLTGTGIAGVIFGLWLAKKGLDHVMPAQETVANNTGSLIGSLVETGFNKIVGLGLTAGGLAIAAASGMLIASTKTILREIDKA